METRTPQCPLSPVLWGHPVLAHEGTCPHMHIQTHMSTHKLLCSAALHTMGC